MAEKLEIQIVEGGGGGTSGSPGPAPGGGTGPGPTGGTGPTGPTAGGGTGPSPGQIAQMAKVAGSEGGVAEAAGAAEMGPLAAAYAVVQAGWKALANGAATAGEVVTRIASINPDAAVDGIQKLGSQLPIVGEAFGAVVGAAHAIANQLDATARRYAQINGTLAQAVAMSDLAQMQGDMRRAEKLAPDLSEFMQSKSNASQSIQDAMASALKGAMPAINKFMKVAEDLSEGTARLAVIAENINNLDTSLTGLRNIGDQIKNLLKKNKEEGQAATSDIHDLMTGKRRPLERRGMIDQPDPARQAIQGGPQMRPFGGF